MRNSQQGIANLVPFWFLDLNHEMLLTVANNPPRFKALQIDPLFKRPLRGDGLMPQVEAKAITSGL